MTLHFKEKLNEQEQLELFKTMNTATDEQTKKEVRLKLMEHNLRLVWKIAENFTDFFEQEELLSIGTIGLINAIDTFDIEIKTKFSRYAYICIIKEITKEIKTEKQARVK